jgi:hypothetical protein
VHIACDTPIVRHRVPGGKGEDGVKLFGQHDEVPLVGVREAMLLGGLQDGIEAGFARCAAAWRSGGLVGRHDFLPQLLVAIGSQVFGNMFEKGLEDWAGHCYDRFRHSDSSL